VRKRLFQTEREKVMDSDEPAVPAGESSVGGSYVSARGIVVMSAYLVLLCASLSYCLVALWPRSAPLAITSIKPDHGPANGGTAVEIIGTGFTEGPQVFFGDSNGKSVTRKSDNVVAVTTPDGKAGSVNIEIDAADGQKASLAEGFTFEAEGQNSTTVPKPVTPAQVLPASTMPDCRKSSAPLFAWACSLSTNVRLLLIVVVVGALGSLVHVIRSFYWYVGNRNLKASWLLMYFLLPFSGAGLALLFFLITRGVSSQPVNIQSSVDGYAALAALVGMFSQQALMKLKKIAEGFFSEAEKGKDPAIPPSSPKITAINPKEGPTSGGTMVTVTGTGLTSVSRITFGGVPSAKMTVVDDAHITATAPAHVAGSVDVEAVTAGGQQSSIPSAFAYVDLSLVGATPSSGPATGGTPVIFSGNGFVLGSSVKIGGAATTSVSVVDAKSISGVTPAGTTGPADIEVTNPDGKSVTLPGGFQFT
jgi:IPT/TIG domain